jgi:hypothetical protein
MHQPRAGSAVFAKDSGPSERISSCVRVMHNDRSKGEILETALAYLREPDGITSQSKHVYSSAPT